MKEIKEDLDKWRDSQCSWIIRHSIKMSILSKFTYRFKVILVKVTASYFVDIDKPILKFTQKGKDPEWTTQY